MGKMFLNILATFAEFEVDLLRMRTREGMAVARAKGRLRGKQPKLSAKQQTELRRMHATGTTPSPTSPNFQHRPSRGVPDSPTVSHPRRLTHPTCSFAADETILTVLTRYRNFSPAPPVVG
jgi:hypothetical protein